MRLAHATSIASQRYISALVDKSNNLTEYLTQKNRKILLNIMWLGLSTLCAVVVSLAGIYLYLDPQIPRPESYRNVQLETPLRGYARDGELLAEYGERRAIPISLDQVPQHFIDALLDTEDKRFYKHKGIDFISLSNDLVTLIGSLLTTGEVTPGASTITMQLARNISFSLERRFLRKFKEMLLSLKIEQELSKDEILELYINMAPFGKRAYGAQAAAFTYYGKPLIQLNLPQLAMLAGIPQLPSAGNPINGPEHALTRRNLVLSRMLDQGSISEAQYVAARAAPIAARLYARELDVPSPYAAEWVRQQAIEAFPDLYSGGYEIRTTIDAAMQREAIDALRRGLASYDRRHGYRGAEGQVYEELREELAQFTPQSDLSEAGVLDGITEILHDLPDYGGLEPAVVIAANDEYAIAARRGGAIVSLALTDSAWARPYIEVDLRGPVPQSMTRLTSAGDVIRITPGEAGTETKDKAEPPYPRWLLTQLPQIQGALVSLDPHDGAVRALVGGYDFYRNQYNHALQAARQPGSGFKPFVYSAALAAGVTPADVFLDAPLVFDDENLESQYRPDNDNNRYNGPTRLREALYRSINLVSMRVLLEVGAGHVLEHVGRFGFDTRDFPRNTQLAIGGGTMAVTPLQMARSYAVLANTGFLIEPHIIDTIRNARGEVVFRANHPQACQLCGQDESGTEETAELAPTEEPAAEPTSLEELLAASEPNVAEQPDPAEVAAGEENPEDTPELEEQLPIAAPRVIDERNVFVMHSLLRDVIKRGTGRSARRLQRGDLAGKTGTTNDAADTWFNGYSPHLVTTVWVGFSNHEPLGARAYGSNTPLPIWIDFMEDALKGEEEAHPNQPPGVVTLKIDPATGERARAGQANAMFEFFLSEFAPAEPAREEKSRPRAQEEIKAIDLF